MRIESKKWPDNALPDHPPNLLINIIDSKIQPYFSKYITSLTAFTTRSTLGNASLIKVGA